MPNVAKTYSISKLFQGPVDAYIGVAAPASSAAPTADANTLTLDAQGQPPSGGTHLGSLEAPAQIQITEKLNEISDDQHESPIAVAFDTVEAEIDITLKETNLSKLQSLLTSGLLGAYNALANSQALQIGGQFDSSASLTTLLLVSPDRAAAGKFLYAMAYKVYLASAIQLVMQRSKEAVYKLKFKAVMDASRVAGDELMQIVRTK